MADINDLEKTYSREQQRLCDGLPRELTPHELCRSRSRSHLAGEESSRSARLRANEKDLEAQLELEKEDEDESEETPSPSPLGSCSNGSDPIRQIIRFENGDPDSPNNWSQPKKIFAIFVAIVSVMNSTMSSSLAAGATAPISAHFHNTNEAQLILPTSIYLVGYCLGPVIWSPISESYGRKWTMITAFAVFTTFSICSAVSPNFAALVIFRLFTGLGGSAALSVVGGICADVYHDPRSRGRSMAIFMAATTFGPILGPPVSGFISVVSWNWTFWVGVIMAGASWPLFIFFPETYAPVILKHRARRLRKETGNLSLTAPIELERTDFNHIVTVVLTRPLRMMVFEPLVLFTCLYLSYAYAIFYISFQSYPLIFTGIYGFNAGEQGLCFLPFGVGALIAAGIYMIWDTILERAMRLKKPWASDEEMRRLPLACVAGPFFVITMFWLGWASRKDIHWIVPVLSGVTFGIGYLCLFMALLNYLVDAYEIFAASAMAAASFSRSSFGAVLPFAAKPMYRALGVAWASSLLGFFSVVLCVIPFVFIRWGDQMRKKSKFCQYLAQKKKEEAEARGREAREADEEFASGEGDVDRRRKGAKEETAEEKC